MSRSRTDPRWIRTCEVCGDEFQQMRPGIRTCGVKCRAQLPHNTGGVRLKAGLAERTCPVCAEPYQPARESQRACSRACHDDLPDRLAAQAEYDAQPARRERQNEARRIGGVPEYHSGQRRKGPAKGIPPQDCRTCGASFEPMNILQHTCSKACYLAQPEIVARAAELRRKPDRLAKVRASNRRNNLRIFHGITVEEFEAKMVAQDGKCMICGQPPKPGGKGSSANLHADHDHLTLARRDLLCINCNVGIGHFRDDPALMRAAAEYIERHRALVAAT